jgi:uncharacterized protein (TIGR02391 family)
VKPEIPETIQKYAEMAYGAARVRIDEEQVHKMADLRASLGVEGLSHSSVLDPRSARLSADRIAALVQAKAEALMEAYELHGKLDDDATKNIMADISALRLALTQAVTADATNQAKTEAWRTRSSSSGPITNAQEFGREVDRLSAPVVDEVGCGIQRRRTLPRKRAAVRPAGAYSHHPEIQRVSGQLFEEGNFRQAVLDAFIHLIDSVRARTGLPYDGDDLMNRAFSPDGRIPPVRFNAFQTQGEKDEQRGIWLLFKGVVGLRNFKAHVVATFDDPDRAHEYLALASLLMRLLDMATVGFPAAPTQDAKKHEA